MSNRELSYFSQEEGKTTAFSAQSESPPRRTNKALTITSRAREVQTFSREKEREASTSSAEEDEWGEFKCAVVSSAQPIRNSNAIDLLSTDFPVINGNERLFKHDIPTLDIVGGLVQQPFENGDDLDFIGPDLSSRPSSQLNVDLFATHKQPPTNRSADLRISPAELPLSNANITSRVPITHDARSSLISSQNAFDKQYSNRNSAFSDLVELNSHQSQKAEKSALSLNVLLNTKKQQPIDNNLS
ncbi:uncharacterized protein LOC135145652 [Zophobas morio]|uniref:uncharacterized protein LOC135145652 n=1 Tax=Zophobas morio TaxID=2755281 RepID=UPI0030834475